MMSTLKTGEIAKQSSVAAYGLELRNMLKLAWPIVLALVAHTSLSVTDSLMVGRINPESLASIGVAGSLFFVTFIVFGGIMMSVSALVAQTEGSGETQKGLLVLCQAMLIATAISIPLVIFFQNGGFFLEQILQQEAVVVQLGADYLRAMSWAILPSLWLVALRSYFEAIARPWPLLFVTLMGVAANILFNLIFIFGYGPIPAMGLTGAGWATSIVFWLMFIAATSYTIKALGHEKPFFNLGKIDTRMIAEIVRVGLPIGVALGFEQGFFALTIFMMGQFGTSALAAHEITLRTTSLTIMIPLGIAAAMTVRVGQAAGRGDKLAVRRSGITGIGLSLFVMCLSALAYLTIPQIIVGFYIDTNNPENSLLMKQAIGFFSFAAVFQFFDGLQASSLGALRGLKDTRVPMVITAIAYWILGFGSLYVLTYNLNMQSSGLWLGLIVALVVAGSLLCRRFLRLSSYTLISYTLNNYTLNNYESFPDLQALNASNTLNSVQGLAEDINHKRSEKETPILTNKTEELPDTIQKDKEDVAMQVGLFEDDSFKEQLEMTGFDLEDNSLTGDGDFNGALLVKVRLAYDKALDEQLTELQRLATETNQLLSDNQNHLNSFHDQLGYVHKQIEARLTTNEYAKTRKVVEGLDHQYSAWISSFEHRLNNIVETSRTLKSAANLKLITLLSDLDEQFDIFPRESILPISSAREGIEDVLERAGGRLEQLREEHTLTKSLAEELIRLSATDTLLDESADVEIDETVNDLDDISGLIAENLYEDLEAFEQAYLYDQDDIVKLTGV